MKKMVEKLKEVKQMKVLFSLPTLIAFGAFIIVTVTTGITTLNGLKEEIEKNLQQQIFDNERLVIRQDHVAELYHVVKNDNIIIKEQVAENEMGIQGIMIELKNMTVLLNKIDEKTD